MKQSRKRIRVLIADDHDVVRQGLRKILSQYEDIEIAGEAENGLVVMKKLHQDAYDVLLLDISMPQKSGIDILAQVRRQFPKVMVLVLSTHSEESYAIPVLQAGGAGYLTKSNSAEDIVEGIRKVANGQKYISSTLAAKLVDVIQHVEDNRALHERLSQRELQVMVRLVNGIPLADIAEEIGCSIKSVSTYRKRVLEKLKLNSTVELIRYAISHHLDLENLSTVPPMKSTRISKLRMGSRHH